MFIQNFTAAFSKKTSHKPFKHKQTNLIASALLLWIGLLAVYVNTVVDWVLEDGGAWIATWNLHCALALLALNYLFSSGSGSESPRCSAGTTTLT